jgi:hypothetical protein
LRGDVSACLALSCLEGAGIAAAPEWQTYDKLRRRAALFTSQANWSRFDSKHECCETAAMRL